MDLITKHKEKEANSNRHRIDDSKLKWTPLGPEIINEEMQSDDADDEEDEQLAKVIEESKRETMETPKTTATEKKKRKRKKGMKGYPSSSIYCQFTSSHHSLIYLFIKVYF